MKKFVLSIFALFCLCQCLSAKLVVGYYNGYYDRYPDTAIDYSCLTHICHAFIYPNDDGSLSLDYWFLYPALIENAHKHGVKVLVSIGGYGVTGFTKMAASPATRTKFVTELVNFCLKNKYDGADLDWEYPKSTDRANLTSLVTELRNAFNNNNIQYLSAALPASDWNNGYDIPALAGKFDWVGIMTYDFTGPWETKAYHNSSLYNSAQQPFSIDASVKYYSNKGMPKSKICAGLPFYGYKLNASGMFGTLNTVSDSKGAAITYSAVQKSYINSSDWESHFDNNTKNVYLQNKAHTQLITYDDTSTTRMKCDYVNSNSLAGAIIWEIKQGYDGTKNELLETVGKSLIEQVNSVHDKTVPVPEEFNLSSYPNPFNPATRIEYSLANRSRVKIEVLDMLGRPVKLLLDEDESSGFHQIEFNATGLASGIYLCRISSCGRFKVHKMILLK